MIYPNDFINKVVQGDCLELLKQLPNESIDLVIADPPYFRIMKKDYTNKSYDWDNIWKSKEEYLNWCYEWIKECYRVLKHNGSIYVFADDKNVSYTHITLEKIGFNLENHIVWYKPNNMPIKGWARFNCYAPVSERILFCSKEHRNRNLNNEFYASTIRAFAPIIEYMKKEKEKLKILMDFKTDEEFNNFINKVTDTRSVVSRHYFTYSQWVFPTNDLYVKLQSINKEVFQKEYQELQKEYQELLRVFKPQSNYTDVWTFNITSSTEKTYHPTQKPIAIINRIINVSTNKNGIVLDPFLGSGTTAAACIETGRRFIGFEKEIDYVKISEARIKPFLEQRKLNGFFDEGK